MKVYAPTTNTHFVIIDIKCDCCNQSCKIDGRYEFMTLRGTWLDEKLTAHVCRKCVDEKFTFIEFKKETWENPYTNQS